MEKYKFNPEHSKVIVDAIVEGYHEYIDHRKDRKEKMVISSAFAWTKGNFIESKVADECKSYGYRYKKSKAGFTWDYLQFIHGDAKSLFLIKNAAYFNKEHFSHATLPFEKKGQQRTYLHELSKINQDLHFHTTSRKSAELPAGSEQLTFFVLEQQVKDELDQFKDEFKEFHILTYKLDEAYQVSEIMHYLPNPEDNIAYLVEDLSDLISGADLTDEDREIVAPETKDDFLDPAAFDIGILGEEKEN